MGCGWQVTLSDYKRAGDEVSGRPSVVVSLPANRRLNDAQLAQAALKLEDPASVDGYTRARSDPTLSPQIVAAYDLTPSGGRKASPDGPWFWCSYCQKENHWRGVLVAGSDGSRHSIGHECAAQHYGHSFDGAKSAFADEIQRKRALSGLAAIVLSAAAVEVTISAILHSAGLKALDLKRREIERACPTMAAQLAAAVKTDAPLREDVTVRDFEAEADWEERTGRASDRPLTKIEQMSLGVVSGGWLLRTQDDCRDRLLGLRKKLAMAVELDHRNTNCASTADLTAAVRDTKEAHSLAVEAVSGARRAPVFFSADNVERIARWSASKTGWSVAATSRGIAVTDSEGRRTEIFALAAVDLPALTPVASPSENNLNNLSEIERI